MKSCLSIIFALIIVTAFVGTAAVIWYVSNSTEMNTGPDAEDVGS